MFLKRMLPIYILVFKVISFKYFKIV